MPTINQLIRKGREKVIQNRESGPSAIAAETRCLYACLYANPKEAELGGAKWLVFA